jgi:hypothetical protein
MKYLITEKQLRMIKKYMKNFINENQTKGYEALEQFPFSKLADTYEEYKENGFNSRVEGWGRVTIPNGFNSSRTINTKDDLREFIDSFKEQYREEPMFELNPNEVWHSKIKIVDKDGNDIFKKDKESEQDSISKDFRYWQDKRNRGDFGR